MEDQGKRLLIAVLLCMLILFGASYLFSPKPGPVEPAPTQETQAPAKDVPPPTGGVPAEAAPTPPPPVKPRGPEQKVTLHSEDVDATFSSYGGALASLTLRGSQYRAKTPDGKEVPMDLVRTPEADFYPLQVTMPESTYSIPEGAEWRIEKRGEREIVASWSSPELEVVKHYRLRPDKYAIDLTVSVKNLSRTEATQRLGLQVFGYQDPSAGRGGMFKYAPPPWQVGCFANGERTVWNVGDLGSAKSIVGDVKWTGLVHKYFLLAVASKAPANETQACVVETVTGHRGVMKATFVSPAWRLAPGQTATKDYVVFAGPKLVDQLEAVSLVAGTDLDLEKAVDWGPPPMKWFTFIARPLLQLLKVFHGWVGNWGVAIILLTLVVKLLTLYWTHKSMKSMKAMGKLKPKMDEIRERYKDDKQRQNLEMMNLYKQHNINPLGGCLPMLLQMPVWMALYSALGAAAELYQAPFFGWIQDLTAPDPYFILPVALTLLMFLQAKISPAAVDSAQQKMMQYMMPIMFGVFSLFFPSGLTVYIFTNTVLSMGHQYYMNKTEEAEAVAGAAKPAPAKKGKEKSKQNGGDGKRPRPAT